jgi:hypothetical protein
MSPVWRQKPTCPSSRPLAAGLQNVEQSHNCESAYVTSFCLLAGSSHAMK